MNKSIVVIIPAANISQFKSAWDAKFPQWKNENFSYREANTTGTRSRATTHYVWSANLMPHEYKKITEFLAENGYPYRTDRCTVIGDRQAKDIAEDEEISRAGLRSISTVNGLRELP